VTTVHLQAALASFHFTAEADPRVVAAFAGGSLATKSGDEYSDLDLYLILADKHYERFFAERVAFMHRLEEPVFLQDSHPQRYRALPVVWRPGCTALWRWSACAA
jgi:predicted nucleotidyltransferase